MHKASANQEAKEYLIESLDTEGTKQEAGNLWRVVR